MSRFLALLSLAFTSLLLPMSSAAPAPITGYAPVNGLRLYYEVHGGEQPGRPPLVLLHGGGDSIRTSFGAILPELAKTRRVIAFEQQGYGRTADIAERPFTFEQSADDTAALLEHLKIPQADFFGFSNGGTIALQVAIRHPAKARRLVIAAGLFSRAGAPAGFWEFMKQAQLENMPQELQDEYRALAPQPENLRLFHDKAANRMRGFADIPVEKLRAIKSPALVVVGDRDVVLPEHAAELSRIISGSQLAVLPGTDHGGLTKRVDWLGPMIGAFLGAPDASK